MADVRALLRAEKASRRVMHSLAYYSSTGQLSCSACRIPIKSESTWALHVRSQQHSEHVEVNAGQTYEASRKRKADGGGQNEHSERKRSRNIGSISPLTVTPEDQGGATEPLDSEHDRIDEYVAEAKSDTPHTSDIQNSSISNVKEAVNEDEWAAFEKDIAINEEQETALSALTAPANVQAQAVLVSDLQAQAQHQEQQSARDHRQAELEADREDASRQLEDEFDEMAAIDDKLKKLKAQREALRKTARSASFPETNAIKLDSSGSNNHPLSEATDTDEEDDQEAGDDLASWSFRRPIS